MSPGVQAAIITPIVVMILLAIWLVLVYRANRRGGEGGQPELGNPRAVPRREVAGGAFRSSGGRQVMPRRDETPAEAEDAGSGELRHQLVLPTRRAGSARDSGGRPWGWRWLGLGQPLVQGVQGAAQQLGDLARGDPELAADLVLAHVPEEAHQEQLLVQAGQLAPVRAEGLEHQRGLRAGWRDSGGRAGGGFSRVTGRISMITAVVEGHPPGSQSPARSNSSQANRRRCSVHR